MLLLATWTLFWKAYWLLVVCLISIPVRRGIRNNREWAIARPEQVRMTITREQEIDQRPAFPPFLRIWEPESPPVLRAAPKKSTVKKEAQKPTNPPKENVRRKKRPRLSAAYRDKLNNQNKGFRKGLKQATKEMVTCINEVADHTTTARELRQTLRLMIRQHPGLRDLPYSQAMQKLLWLENMTAQSQLVGETGE